MVWLRRGEEARKRTKMRGEWQGEEAAGRGERRGEDGEARWEGKEEVAKQGEAPSHDCLNPASLSQQSRQQSLVPRAFIFRFFEVACAHK